jgi:hypothetical protein
LEARVGDVFIHPDVRDKIRIEKGFLFVATGNEDTERGRAKLPGFVLSQFLRLEAANPSNIDMEKLIAQIIEADYPKAKQSNVLPRNIRLFAETLKNVLNIIWIVRKVLGCLLKL